ncbi:hypothetical protein PN836_000695 [Ningiella sp. W23]|uniref:hypothetical protein n=1 Tax=Ningiella sp. W23 TaxID=3023715 RepID=UPI0037564B12
MGRIKKISLLCALSLSIGACTQLGSNQVETQRNSYTDVIALSDKQELLSNIVRAKYNDPPVFLQIKTITVAPSIRFASNANLSYDTRESGLGTSIGPSIEYKDEPRIILSPLEGAEFANELLLPTGLMPVYLMLINGFSFDKIADLMLISVNDISNRRSASLEERKKFRQTVQLIQSLIDQGVLYVTVSAQSVKDGISNLNVKVKNDQGLHPELLVLMQLLDIKIENGDIPISIGQEAGVNKINVHTRSLLSVINYLSNYVDVPEMDKSKVWPVDFSNETQRPIHVRTSDGEPTNADVAINHRGQWFYIDETDIDSQNALYLLRVMFDLQAERNENSSNLLLTLPVQ